MSPYSDDPDEDRFETTRGISFLSKTPNHEDAAKDELTNVDDYFAYLWGYVQKTEDAIFGPGFKDADGKSYRDYLDVDAMVKYWWVQEFSKNGDAYNTSSTYLYKKGNGLLCWGPLWDFDLAWTSIEYLEDDSGLTGIDSVLNNSESVWANQLKGDPAFLGDLKSCWNDTFKAKVAEITQDGGLLDRYYGQTLVSWLYDKEKSLEYQASSPDGGPPVVVSSLHTQVDQLKRGTSELARLTDGYLDNFSETIHELTFVADGATVQTLYTPNGKALGHVPEPPSKEGYVPLGWMKADGSLLEAEETVDSDMTLTAEYVESEKAVWPKNIHFASYHPCTTLNAKTFTPEFTITPFNAQDKKVTWTSSAPSVAYVRKSGEVRLLAVGTVTITATLARGVTGSYELTVAPTEADCQIEPESITLATPQLKLAVDGYGQVLFETVPQVGAWVTYNFESSDTSVATVDSNGVVCGLKTGSATIQIEELQSKRTFECAVVVGEPDAGSKDAKVPETSPSGATTSIQGAELVLSETAFVYDGAVQRPTVKTVGGKVLRADVDYTLKWSDADSKDAGTYTVTAIGKGAYEGTSAQATYEITKANNTLKVAGRTIKVKAKQLKKKAKKVKAKKAYKITKNASKGKLTYKRLSISCKKKLLKQAKKKIRISSSGKVTLKKGLKKGTYKVKVIVKQKATDNYESKTVKYATLKTKVA